MPSLHSQQRGHLTSFPIWLALGYFVISAVYIGVSDRFLAFVVSDPHRLTQIQSFKGWAFVTATAVLLFVVVRRFTQSMIRAEESLAAVRLDYRRLVETITDGVCVTDAAGTVVFVNDRLCELLGLSREKILRDGVDDAVGIAPPSAHSQVYPADEVRITRPDGSVRWVILSEAPLGAPGDNAPGRLRVLTDNTARRQAADEMARLLGLQHILISELDHRVRNNLASLVAIIEVAARGNPDVERFAAKVTGRVRIMAAAYSLLSEAKWQPVQLQQIVAELTAPAEEKRSLDGPPVAIQVDQVVPLMLVLYELFTNAREHGSLKAGSGRLLIRWRTLASPDPPKIVMDWIERDGPAPPAPATAARGFGLAMAAGIASSDLRGGLEFAAEPDGAQITLTISLDRGQWRPTGGRAGSGAGPRACGSDELTPRQSTVTAGPAPSTAGTPARGCRRSPPAPPPR